MGRGNCDKGECDSSRPYFEFSISFIIARRNAKIRQTTNNCGGQAYLPAGTTRYKKYSFVPQDEKPFFPSSITIHPSSNSKYHTHVEGI